MSANLTRFIRMSDLTRIVGLSKSTIWDMVRQETFPAPFKYGRATFWTSEDVAEWQQGVLKAAGRIPATDLDDLL